MTRIRMWREGDAYAVEAEGHSSDAACCNFITGLLYAFGFYLLRAEKNDRRAKLTDFKLNDAWLYIRGTGGPNVRLMFESLHGALSQLQKEHPDALTVE